LSGRGGLRAAMTGELCWRERKLLIDPPMQNRSNGRGHTKCSRCSSRFGVGHGANDPTPGKVYCYETMEEAKAYTGL
jgi:hypothetical protein